MLFMKRESPEAAMLPSQNEEEDIAPSDDQETSEWIAVLAAAGLDYRLSHQAARWAIHVPRRQAAAARRELAAYEADEKDWPPRGPTAPEEKPAIHDSWSPWWVSGFLIAFYVWLGPYDGGNAVLRRAAVDAEAILRGEWWRLITALTVHSDPGHLAGNVLCLLLVGWAVCQSFGGGLGWALVLAAGIAGNAVACLFHGQDHVSVGASTACFAALGIMATCQAIRNLRRFGGARTVWSRTWIPLGAGLALLTLLGTGPRSDLAAHAFGFVAGLLLSLPCSLHGTKWRSVWGQRALQMGCVVVVMTAWRAAVAGA